MISLILTKRTMITNHHRQIKEPTTEMEILQRDSHKHNLTMEVKRNLLIKSLKVSVIQED
jgi:hypothetical protein